MTNPTKMDNPINMHFMYQTAQRVPVIISDTVVIGVPTKWFYLTTMDARYADPSYSFISFN